ncbi:MAG: transglycosylase domain-containing protein, partial [Lachnospiraceae bacterium]|nr:transglycosylase domain-containing protein [Candidatus Hippenecus merdae]
MFAVKAAVIILALLLFTAAISMGTGMLIGIVKNAPEVEELTFSPVGYASKTLDSEGNVTATLVQAGSNREEAKFEEFPEDLINAVVAVEDQRFWDHDGIDLRSITRAVKGVVSGDSSAGGGSTLTQQLVKNNVFGGGNEHGFALYERKFQEW